ncbi:MATE family efflux transporter [Halococcoides cellulosivorans]|uniref:Multidrug-efflux transporter n=1 Tax=Halococcoides cellulosivorans TaxID=1679096 RepID=A0A2R4WY35_9EURY|nr:MATE family efflux transporter [Halococcoides cellulosivorans]AWB26442.1 MATE family efflux transporter [Halococcoides cellulosivorans]
MAGIRSIARRVGHAYVAALAWLGLVDRTDGEAALALAAPVMVTGGLRVLLRVADFAMVGWALGDAAIAGLELGFQYYFVGFGLSLAISSGTISVVSRLHGAGEYDRANRAVAQSLWLAVAIGLPLTVLAWLRAPELVGLLTPDPDVVRYGSTYLAIVMLAMVPRFWSMVAARALAGGGDTVTPMAVRTITLPTNVVLNAVLIFGLGPAPRLGVAGAAIGTVIANAIAAGAFLGLLLSGRFVVALPRRPTVDPALIVEIVRVALPLAGMRLLQTGARFPFLAILGLVSTPAVAAYAVGRRVVMLAMMPAWGFATASSTLVGQRLGGEDPDGARSAGWQTARIALVTQVGVAIVIVAAARPIAHLFGTAHPDLVVAFVRTFGVIVASFSLSRTMRGALRGAGDTRWPLYGTVLGSTVRLAIAALALPAGLAVALPALGTVTIGAGLGLPAIYTALVADYALKAAVNTYRFHSGRWRAVANAARLDS